MGAAFLIPTLLSAAGTAAQYVNSSRANQNQNAAEVQSIQDSQKYKTAANQDVTQLTSQIAKDNPAQLQDQATQKYIQAIRSNVGSGTQPNIESSLSGQSGANPRYATAEKNSSATVQNFGDTLASEKAGTDAAVRQRQNEGLDMGTLATQLSGLNQNAYSTGYADQLRATTAGQQNPWVMAAASALGNYANAMSKNPTTPISTNVTPPLWAGGDGITQTPAGINSAAGPAPASSAYGNPLGWQNA